ncbi:hypothetical protein OF897_08220 [Chryseobacterium formosus]|uniref:Uncharacterized protein n=1 Tax=Chryseobacterium formosus TaxID=1537363 RepID=A0ABT3XP51_9FLAO|nr:hypothetical protein [Chryseobacterium formosus]MCX8523909.1 hypothetical protein [Chryseobacterium formosus]
MKSLKEFIAENLEHSTVILVQENTENISENKNQETVQEAENVKNKKTEKDNID